MDSIRFKLSSESSLPQETFLKPFQNKEKDGSIDVWWLYDDGGHIKTVHDERKDCNVKIAIRNGPTR